jgi:hypothetical protein
MCFLLEKNVVSPPDRTPDGFTREYRLSAPEFQGIPVNPRQFFVIGADYLTN